MSEYGKYDPIIGHPEFGDYLEALAEFQRTDGVEQHRAWERAEEIKRRIAEDAGMRTADVIYAEGAARGARSLAGYDTAWHRDLLGGADPVGVVEVADRLGVGRKAVDKWRQRDLGFPAPTWTVGGRPAWRWEDVERWARETGRA